MYVQICIKKNNIYIYIYRRMHCLCNKHMLTLTARIISPVWSDCTMLITNLPIQMAMPQGMLPAPMGPMGSNHPIITFRPKGPAQNLLGRTKPRFLILIWSTGSVFVSEKDIAHISQIDALRRSRPSNAWYWYCPYATIHRSPPAFILLSIPTLWSQLCVDPQGSTMVGLTGRDSNWSVVTSSLSHLQAVRQTPAAPLHRTLQAVKGEGHQTRKPPKNGEVRPNRCLG